MSAAPGQAVALGAARLRRFTGSPGGLFEYLSAELAARPRRLARAVRLALMASVGNGLMAAMHVESVYGPYLLWAVAAAPRPMMTPAEAARLIITEGVLLVLSVPLAGVLVEVPWFYVPLFVVVVAARAHLVKRYNLSNAWLLVGITALNTFYAIVFDPKNFGWDAASTFGGAAIAFGVITLFDWYLWPDPAEAALLDAAARDLERMRERIRLVRRAYFDPRARGRLASRGTASQLTVFLTLLDRAGREGASASRTAQLLALVTLNERLRMEVERLRLLASEPVPATLRDFLRTEAEAVLEAIDAAFGALAAHLRSGLAPGNEPAAAVHARIAAALAELDAHSTALALLTRPGTDPAEIANLSSFFLGMHALAFLLEKGPDYPQLSVPTPGTVPPHITDPETTRHALKLAVAMAAMLIIALTSQRPEMTAALWTVFIAGQPSHGATFRKMALRIAGVLVGGVAAIAMIIIVTPNFDTVMSYMIACFLVLVGCAWAAQSSERIAYAGSQAGTTFVLVFAGLSPSARIYEPLWRLWAVFLGVGVTGTVFLLMWRDYAATSMLPRLTKLLNADLQMIPRHGQVLGDGEIDLLQTESTDALTQLLKVADDARLEGPSSGVHADAIVDAAGTLRRMAHRLGSIAAGRGRQRPLSAASEDARRAFEEALRRRLSAWRDYFLGGSLERHAAEAIRDAHRADDLQRSLTAFVARISMASYAEIAAWPLDARRTLMAETESFHRLVVLSGELDQQFAAVRAV